MSRAVSVFLYFLLLATSTLAQASRPAAPASPPVISGGNSKPINTTISLSGSSVANATDYQFFWGNSAGSMSQRLNPNSTSTGPHSVSTGPNERVRYVRYRACNSSGCSTFSPATTLSIYGIPGTPSSAPSIAGGNVHEVNTNISLSASAVSLATEYQFFWGNSANSMAEKLNPNSTSNGPHSVSTGPNGRVRYVRYRACSSAGCSSFSPSTILTIFDIPAAPSGAPTIAGGNSKQINMTISISGGTVAHATEYQFFWGNSAGSMSQRLNPNSTSTGPHSVSTGPNERVRYVRYRACNSYGCSDFSPTTILNIYGIPETPTTTPLITGGNTHEINTTISLTADPVSLATEYQFFWGNTDSAEAMAELLNPDSTSTGPHSVSTGPNERVRFVRYRACSSAGCSGFSPSTELEILGIPVAPVNAPTISGGMYHEVNSEISITGEDVLYATEYEYFWGNTPEQMTEQLPDGPVLTGANARTRYIQYRGCSSAGCGPLSDSTEIYIYAEPDEPQSLSASKASLPSSESVDLTWSAAPGLIPDGYYSIWETKPGQSSVELATTTELAASVTPDGDDGVYLYEVKACNPNVGCGAGASESITLDGLQIVANDDVATANKGQQLVIEVLSNDTAPDGVILTIINTSNAINGTVVCSDSDCTFTAVDDISSDVTGSFDYTISDGNGGTDSATVTVDILNQIELSIPVLTIERGATTGDFTLTWDTIENAGQYRIEEWIDDSAWALLDTVSDGLALPIYGRQHGSYSFRIRAETGSGVQSDWSVSKSFNVLFQASQCLIQGE